MSQSTLRFVVWWAFLLAFVVHVGGCSDSQSPSTESVVAQTPRLTTEQQAILGFERPTTDWSATSGAVSASTTVSQGTTALSLVPSGWTELTSVQLSSLGPVKSTLSVDLTVPSTPSWGEIRIVLVAPSLGMGWNDLGGQSVAGLSAGQYHKLTFALPSVVEAALEGTYSDLQIKVILNAQVFSAPYLFDNIDLSEAGGTEPPASTAVEFTLVVPEGQSRESMMLSAQESLQVDDRVEVASPGQRANVGSLGATGTHFGSALLGHCNIFSTGKVWLRSQSVVEGLVRSGGIIDKQDLTVDVQGVEQPGIVVQPHAFTWSVQFPGSPAALPAIGSNAEVALEPGAYHALNIQSGRVSLRTGTYYFDSINVEPAGEIRVNNASGSVFIYVKDSFVLKGPIVDQGPRQGKVLVGYLGSSIALLQAPMIGTLVAQNAKIELRRPNSGVHKGSWFGKSIQAFSDSHLIYLPFDWNSLPGATQTPNGDGDPEDNLHDACLLDPNKTEPLICGCNKPEDDDDLDGVPNCVDACPHDANNTHPGPCGCLGEDSLQPAGVRCMIERCSGSRQQGVCDGQGQCGVPACDPIPGGCSYREFGDRGYFFCSGPVDWEQAESLCKAEPGRSLVRVDGRVENLWISSILNAPAWLGGSDLTRNKQWFWSTDRARDGKLFWSSGLPIPGRYTHWASGRPELTETGSAHCLSMRDDGSWSNEDCSNVQGFVCEQPLLRLPPPVTKPRLCDFYPIVCEEHHHADEPCVNDTVEFPSFIDPNGDPDYGAGTAEMERIAGECSTCTDDDAPFVGCAAERCTGFANPPPIGGTCPDFSAQEKAFCDLVEVHPSATCSVANPGCPTGYVCGRRQECAALDASHQPLSCQSDGDCASGQYCGHAVKVCINPLKQDRCEDIDDDGECVGLCFGSLACGHVRDTCAGTDDGALLNRCSETPVCPDPDAVDLTTDPLSDENSNLTEQEFPSEQYFPTKEDPPPPYATAKPADCGGEGEPECHYANGEHPWCKYEVDQSQKPAARTASDSDPAFQDSSGRGKQGSGGSAGPIRFDFDPNLAISYDFGELLPLGDSEFKAAAEASARAAAHFSLFGINGDVNILDALGRLDADRCGVSTDAYLKLFGYDFLPILVGDEVHKKLTELDTSATVRQKCEDAIGKFRTAVNRAQKALRDAQELIRQQQELVASGKRFKPDLCHLLLETAGKGVPSNFPSPDAPFAGCGNLTPEETINLFVRFYKQEIYNLVEEQATLLRDGAPDFPQIEIPFLKDADTAGSVDDARRETQQVANITFPIGPIPLNLTIEAYVQYGVAGALTFSVTPTNLLTAYQSEDRQQLANVDATVTPFAGAGVSMFLGVGFDFGALSAKAGIEGDVSLGLVTLPIYAGAGVNVQSDEDDRALPADLSAMVSSADAIFPPGPPKKFRFDAYYKFGANATISDILSGSISAKLRIKFFFFSKTWRKTVAKFGSPFDPIDIRLISGGGDASLFADDFGLLGAVRMPVPFVDLNELEPQPDLPPLPETGGAGGTSATGGASGGGSGGTIGGSGGAGGNDRPPVSLLVKKAETDPRYVDFNPGRVEKLFHSGYCECGAENATCSSSLDCCGTASCVFNDKLGKSQCSSCVAETSHNASGGFLCQATSECCQNDPQGKPVSCYPLNASSAQKHCQACRGEDEPVIDNDGDGTADYGECCAGLRVFRAPVGNVLNAAAPICSDCRDVGESCNMGECCPATGMAENFCNAEHKCEARGIIW